MLNAIIEFFRWRKEITFFECWECGQYWKWLFADNFEKILNLELPDPDGNHWVYIPYRELAVLRWNKHIEKNGETCPECFLKIEHGITPEWVNIYEQAK